MKTVEVLIADDSGLILKMVKKALLENTFDHYAFEEDKIYLAQNGMEAFEIIGKNKNITMLISDINMPYLNGDELVEILVDTHLHDKIQTIFITTDESIIKPNIKKHSIGIITKPFNALSFGGALNELLTKYHDEKTKMLNEQSRYQAHLHRALNAVFEQYAIAKRINQSLIQGLINKYIVGIQERTDEEIEFVFYAILEDLAQSEYLPSPLDYHALKAVWTATLENEHLFTLALIPCMKNTIVSCQELLSQKKEVSYQTLMEAFTTSLSDKVALLKTKVSLYQPSKHLLYSAHMKHLVENFEEIDPLIRDDYLNELFTYKYEIEEFIVWMRHYQRDNRLEEEFPQLKNSPHLLKDIYGRYAQYMASLNKIQYYIVGEIEKYVLSKIYKSKKSVGYLQEHMNNILPTTSNILYHMKKLHPNEHKRLVETDCQNVVVLSTNIDFLMRFKNEYEQMSPHVKIFCFTKNSLFEHWLGSNQIDKLIVDYDFSSAIFGSGVIYLKYFFKQNRKNRAVISLERFNRYYLISSYDDVMKEKEHLNTLNPHIIEKPLLHHNVRHLLMYS